MSYNRTDVLFGSMIWGGIFKGMPAVVGSYHNGASLYVFNNNKWCVYTKSKICNDVIPRKCSECGTELPINTSFVMDELFSKSID